VTQLPSSRTAVTNMRFVIGEYYLGKAIEGMSAFHPFLPLEA
jgi:hypothetical protein